MTSRRETQQYTFLDRDGGVLLGERISDWIGTEATQILSSRDLWREKPKGRCIYLDLGRDEYCFQVFNPFNGQILETTDLSPGSKEKFAGLVILSPGVEEKDLDVICNGLSLVIPVLRKESPVILFEEKSEAPLDKAVRLFVFEGARLVERHLLVGLSRRFDVWEARVEKRRKRAPIDLTDKSRPRARAYIERLWEELRGKYEIEGYELVNPKESEMAARLKSSKNPPDDLRKLRLGYGIVVKRKSCDCRWEISLRGIEEQVEWCPVHAEYEE